MEHRQFFVALGVPKGADTDTVQVAYRKVVARYRHAMQGGEQKPEAFTVVRTYSERRHAALFEQDGPAVPPAAGEVDEFYGGYVPEVPGTHRATPAGKDLFVELRISPDDARRGGIFPVHIPVLRPCPSCEDDEREEGLVCPACHDSGRITDDHAVDVTVPPEVGNGQVARLAMQDVGLGHTELIVRVLISAAP